MKVEVGQRAQRSLTSEHVRKYSEISGESHDRRRRRGAGRRSVVLYVLSAARHLLRPAS
jgi:hypothetical protein